MRGKERLVFIPGVKMVRRQYHRQHRYAKFELHRQQGTDDRIGHEFVPVDASVDHEAAGCDRVVAASCRQPARVQRQFERTGHFEHVDRPERYSMTGHLGQEGVAGALDDVGLRKLNSASA